MGKLIALQGGAAYGAEPAGRACATTPEYDVYKGSSTGAGLGLLMALGKWDEIHKEYTQTTNREMFGRFHPFNKSGEISDIKVSLAFINMLRKKRNYMFNIGPGIAKKINKCFSKEDYKKLYKSGKDVIVTAKNSEKLFSGTDYVSIQQDGMYYELFKAFVIASMSIPFFAKPRLIDGYQYVDGGTFEITPSQSFKKYENYQKDIWLMHSIQDETSRYSSSDGLGLLKNLFVDMRYEVGQGDMAVLDNDNTKVYYTSHKEWNSANFDPKLMTQAFDEGYGNPNPQAYRVYFDEHGVLKRRKITND